MLNEMERVARNVQKATTEDLLNRVTAYRAGMEPEALVLIEQELRRRDVTDEQIEAHLAQAEPEVDVLLAEVVDESTLRLFIARWGWTLSWLLAPKWTRARGRLRA